MQARPPPPNFSSKLLPNPNHTKVAGATMAIAANMLVLNAALLALSTVVGLLPADYEFPVALGLSFVITFVNVVGCSVMTSKTGKSVSIMGFFVFFLALFYGVRGASFAYYQDDALALKLGITDVHGRFGDALTWVNVFTTICCITYGLCARRQVKPLRLMAGWVTKLIPQTHSASVSPASMRSGAVVLVIALVVVVFFVVLGRTAYASGQFVITAPFSYGLALAGFAGLVSIRSRGLWWVRFACGLVLLLVATYFTRSEYSSRVYAVGLPALALGFVMAHYRLYALAMVTLISVLPIVQGLGESRNAEASEAVSVVASLTAQKVSLGPVGFILQPYTETSGDFTALDVFASVLNGEQEFRPWGLSLPYALVHWVPRQLWPNKPVGGILTDEASFRLARVEFDSRAELIPYDPGIVGNLFLEGGSAFIILGAIVMGWIGWQCEIALQYLFARPTWLEHGYAIYSIFLVTAFFAVRFRPYQLIYLLFFLLVGYYVGAKAVRFVNDRVRL